MQTEGSEHIVHVADSFMNCTPGPILQINDLPKICINGPIFPYHRAVQQDCGRLSDTVATSSVADQVLRKVPRGDKRSPPETDCHIAELSLLNKMLIKGTVDICFAFEVTIATHKFRPMS